MSTTRVSARLRAPRPEVFRALTDGVTAEDNELGWHMALDRLAALLEGRPTPD